MQWQSTDDKHTWSVWRLHPGLRHWLKFKRRRFGHLCLSRKHWLLFSLLSRDAFRHVRSNHQSTFAHQTPPCARRQKPLYQPLNLVSVSGGSPTGKIFPVHQFLLLLLFGKPTLCSKVRVFGGHFLGILEMKGYKISCQREVVMMYKRDNLYKKISSSEK